MSEISESLRYGAHMLKVGLTGGIASGKTSVANQLRDLGATIIDSDVLAREVVEPGTDGFAEVVKRFGNRAIGPDGSLDRPWLGSVVFLDENARRDLNAIIHPRVRKAARLMEAKVPDDGVAVQVIPLLVETNQQDDFDCVVVVDVPEEVQIKRLMARNGFTRPQAESRIRSQASRQERLAVADFVIDNSGSFEHTRIQVEELWRRLVG